MVHSLLFAIYTLSYGCTKQRLSLPDGLLVLAEAAFMISTIAPTIDGLWMSRLRPLFNQQQILVASSILTHTSQKSLINSFISPVAHDTLDL